MVYTVTFNPAIDYVIRIEEVKLGATNRSEKEEIYFGGKGINVSIVLEELGIVSKALGFTAGFTGEAIEKELAYMGIDTDFVRLETGNSRINVKIKSVEETELNGQGPDIDNKAIAALFEKLDGLKDGAMLIDEFGKVHRCGVCKGTVKNSVGAGDSMVAGFVAGALNGDYEYALKLGTVAGGATAFSDGLATREKISELLKKETMVGKSCI